MPFIGGRYHINPAMGQALEAARDAEAALGALEQQARSGRQPGDSGGDDDFSAAPSGARAGAGRAKGPVHRVEIEAAELVPAHSGRAARGFVARVHRAAPPAEHVAGHGAPAHPGPRAGAETHVFAHHGDLMNFLRDALGNDGADGE